MNAKKPTLGVLLGDSCGIGPEIVAKLAGRREIYDTANMLIVGDYRVFRMAQRIAGLAHAVTLTDRVDSLAFEADRPAFYHYPALSEEEVTLGKVNARSGKAVIDALFVMMAMAQERKVDGFVFGPFNKEAMILAGFPFHSELDYFKEKFDRPEIPGEVNLLEDLWATRVTSHIAVSMVSAMITKERVYNTIRFLNGVLRLYGIESPRLAVAALNPHCGEGGLCGTEEVEVIGPAIMMAKSDGIDASGPFPADTIFLRVPKEKYNGVISMYHDQGQIATKLLGFDRGVTVHGGLPVAIATPAHGTAFDIAGQGKANPEAMTRAFLAAARLALRLA